jgi:hypothetical protein
MVDERKTVYVNNQPISIFVWAEVQHCVNAYSSELFLKVEKGEAEIVDENGGRIGWGGFAGEGQHIYVRSVRRKPRQRKVKRRPSD